MRVEASAPAKSILFGEHFVVRGARAIAGAVGLRARISVEPWYRTEIWSEDLSLGALPGERAPEPLAIYLGVLEAMERLGYNMPHRAVIRSEIPMAAGLGSSAATSAAYALALSSLHGDPLRGERLFSVTMEGERIAHGNPSGVDAAIAVYGGILAYRRGEEPKRIASRIDTIILADSGVKRKTREAVSDVLSLTSRHPWLDRLYAAADELVSEAIEALSRGDRAMVGELMNINHGLLSAVGVSSRELEETVYLLRSRGALGAKLTGAGRGGFVIAVADNEEAIVSSLRAEGRKVYLVRLGDVGAQVDFSSF